MELQEIIDLLDGKRKLSEMAFPLKQVCNRLMDKALKINRFTHLILIYYFRDQQEADHWIGELSGFIPESPKIKGKNRRLDEDDTFHYIWKGFAEDYSPEEFHRMYFSNAFDTEENKRQNIENKTGQNIFPLPWDSVKQNPKDVYSFMEEFHKIISNKLTEKGDVFTSEIRETISSLLNNHKLL